MECVVGDTPKVFCENLSFKEDCVMDYRGVISSSNTLGFNSNIILLIASTFAVTGSSLFIQVLISKF